MDIRDTLFYKQADLLLQVLPIISKNSSFALKGGTALNFFIRDLPRISVDIDLAYLPLDDRDTALSNINDHLQNIILQCERMFSDVSIGSKKQNGLIYGLTIHSGGVGIKIEPNTIIRGSVYPPEKRELTNKTRDLFGRSVEMHVLSMEDLYGGKICAALDRQHPRDLYDIYILFNNEGLTEKIRHAFIVYLLSHNRPISELLDPNLKTDLEETYKEAFEGMAFNPVKLDDLTDAWHQLVKQLHNQFTDREKELILSFLSKSPNWELFPVANIKEFPAIKWKLLNIGKMSKSKHKEAIEKLERILGS